MQMKTHRLVTVRSVREVAQHEVELPANLDGDDLLAVLYQMASDGLLEDKRVECTDVSNSATYYDKDDLRSDVPLMEIEGREVTFKDDESIEVKRTNEDDPEFGTVTYNVPDPGPLSLNTTTGVISSEVPA